MYDACGENSIPSTDGRNGQTKLLSQKEVIYHLVTEQIKKWSSKKVSISKVKRSLVLQE